MDYDLKDKVAIVGAGCTKFGENFDMSFTDMLHEACWQALTEAGIGPEDVDAVWLSCAFPDAGVYRGRSGMEITDALSLYGKPVTRVSNYCASGGDAVQNGIWGLLSGRYRIVLVAGVEKLRDRAPQESLIGMVFGTGHPFYTKGLSQVGIGAVYASRHFEKYGLTKVQMAKVSVNNHHNGIDNPRAQYRQEISLDAILNAPMVAWPIGVLDCCPTTDGAGAVVMVRREDAKTLNPDYALIKGQGFACSGGLEFPYYDPDNDFTVFRSTVDAAKVAYEQAGVKDPLEEVDCAEIHDCFTSNQIIMSEALGFCPRGQGGKFVDEGFFWRGGKLVINSSGGLLCCGHPVGATGLRMVYELKLQVTGKAGGMQVPNAKLGLACNMGGTIAVSTVTLIGAQ